jgi:hypothetical protein
MPSVSKGIGKELERVLGKRLERYQERMGKESGDRAKKIAVTDPPGFEPGSEAPEASILSRLYYESKWWVPVSANDQELSK